jgi:uncharacterized membrane protein
MEFELLLAYVVIYGTAEIAYLKATSPFYRAHFESVQGSPPQYRLGAAALAYVVLFVVVYYFVIHPVFDPITRRTMPKMREVLTTATMLALAIYGMYNLTNLATLKNYGIRVAVQDTAWGIVVLNLVALACYYLKVWVLRSGDDH